MRLLHCIHSVNPAGGGPIEGVKQIARVHLAAGHAVEVASLDDPAAPWLATCPLPLHALGPGRLKYGWSPRFVPWLRAQRGRFDAVIVNGLWQYHAVGVRRALRAGGPPYFVYPHGMLDPWFKRAYPLKHVKKWLYWPWADYRVLRDAAAVLFTGEEERRRARESFALYRCTERVVQYGTPGPPPGDPEPARRSFASRWPATAGKRCLLHLGRLHPKKGTDLVLQAFAARRAALPPAERGAWHLIVAGPAEGAYGRTLPALARQLGLDDAVTWTGPVADDLKWGAFHQAEALLLPSHQENFGVVVAEALACGRPVLLSDQVNIWREIVADDAGLADTDDLAGTARLLARWAALTAEERQAMGTRARRCFATRFGIEAAAASLLAAMAPFVRER